MQTTSILQGTFWNAIGISLWRHSKCSNVNGQSNCLLPILGVSLARIRRKFALILPNISPWNKLRTLFQGHTKDALYLALNWLFRGTQRPICCKMYYYTPVNENKFYYGIFRRFSVLLGKHYLFLFPSKTHNKFPSQLVKIGWFPSQLIKFISQPGIPRAFKSLDRKRPNKSDKTGFLRKRNHSDQLSYVCDYSLGEGRGSFFFFFFF